MANKSSLYSFFNKKKIVAWVLIMPSVIDLLIFLVIPLVIALVMSFTNATVFMSEFEFIGLNNYVELFQDSRFLNSMLNTIYYMALFVPLGTLMSLVTAAYVQKSTLFRKALRSILYIPTICSMTAISIIWALLLDPNIGTISYCFPK
jgi:ABC-type sugar transport systems, permease components